MSLIKAIQLLLTSLLFVGWIGWLAVQATMLARIPVLSVAQAIQADADVLVQLQDHDGTISTEATVERVLWSRDNHPLQPGDKLNVPNLTYTEGYTGPGLYLVNLRLRDGQTRTALPGSSPGLAGWTLSSRIYRWSEVIEKQWQRLRQ